MSDAHIALRAATMIELALYRVSDRMEPNKTDIAGHAIKTALREVGYEIARLNKTLLEASRADDAAHPFPKEEETGK